MGRVATILFVLFVVSTTMVGLAGAGGVDRRMQLLDGSMAPGVPTIPAGRVFGAGVQGIDTFWYGGTQIISGIPCADEPSSPGWANRKMWTWSADGYDGTPHSGLNMDGWVGVDNTNPAPEYPFRRMSRDSLGECSLNGNWEMFCGLTSHEAWTLCFADTSGTGYGDNWSKQVASPTFAYSGSGPVTLKYIYRVDSYGGGYDSVRVAVDVYDQINAGPPPDSGWVKADSYPYPCLASYSGSSGLAQDSLDISSKLAPHGAIKYRVRVYFISHYFGNDQYGGYPTACGAFGFDDVSIAGGVVNYFSDFETGTDWAPVAPPDDRFPATTPAGDFARAVWADGLSPSVSEDPCAAVSGLCDLADSVIVFFDPTPSWFPHPMCQDNHIQSPTIYLGSHPDHRGFVLHYEYFAKVKTCPWGEGGDGAHPYWGVRYWLGPNGRCWSEWTTDLYFTQDRQVYTGGLLTCGKTTIDVSSLIPAGAESVQVCLGVWNEGCNCDDCCYDNNNTPYFDNVSFGVHGNDSAPVVAMDETWRWQDQFPKDGTISSTSTVDTRTGLQLKTNDPTVFGDTLLCNSGSANAEISLVFRIPKVGPGIQAGDLFFTTWFPGLLDAEGHPTGAWQTARMDTAEAVVGGVPPVKPSPGYWMAAFHEDGPIRIANSLSEGTEILPNGLFTPGTRVEYFLKSKFIGGESEFVLPDTSGGHYLEFEVLPMIELVDGVLRWPCLLLANHSSDVTGDGRRETELVEDALRASGFVYDKYDRLAAASASSTCGSGLGRASSPGSLQGPGATVPQLMSYRAVVVTGARAGYTLSQIDVPVLDSWLAHSDSLHTRFLWISGDQTFRLLSLTFLQNKLCAAYVNYFYSVYSGDMTYCLPADGWSGGRIECGPLGGPENEHFILAGNRCTRQFDVGTVSGVQGCSGLRELGYNKAHNGQTYAASVSGVVSISGGASYKSLIEGYSLAAIRSDASLGPTECATDTASAAARAAWVQCVLGSFAGLAPAWYCNVASISVSEPPGGIASAPYVTTSLGQSYPNPMNPVASISFSVGKSGKVSLRIYDIVGRVVRTLFDENVAEPGQFKIVWDGSNDRCGRVASGVFFYQLEAPGYKSAKKLVIFQ